MKNRNFLLIIAAILMLTFLSNQRSPAQNNPPERVYIFARDTTKKLTYRMFDGANWGQWESLGGVVKGAPDACSPNPGEVKVFIRGESGPSDSELFYKTLKLGKTPTTWKSFHTKFGSDPGVVCRSGGNVDVFTRGFDNFAVWHAWYENGKWSNQFSVKNPFPLDATSAVGGKTLGGAIIGGTDACSWGGQRLDIFARGNDNFIWHKFRDDQGVWHEWESLGGLKMTSDPSAVARANGQMSIFARGENNQIWTRTYTLTNDRWSPWLPIGGVHAGGPDATRTADNRIDVFSRGADSAVWHTSVTYKGNIPDIKSVPAWESLGGKLTSDPSAVGVNW